MAQQLPLESALKSRSHRVAPPHPSQHPETSHFQLPADAHWEPRSSTLCPPSLSL